MKSFLLLTFVLISSLLLTTLVNAAAVVNPLDVSKISLEQNTFLSSTCDGDNTVFTYSSSWLIRICDIICGVAGINLTSIVDTVTSELPGLTVDQIVITPLSALTATSNTSVVSLGDNTFQLLDTSLNNIIPLCEEEQDFRLKSINNNIHSSSSHHHSNLFGNNNAKSLGKAKLIVKPSISTNSFLQQYPLFADNSAILQQTPVCFTDNTTCFVYRLDVTYSFTVLECPIVPIVVNNSVSVSARMCDCSVGTLEHQTLSPIEMNYALQQCNSNKTFCANTSAITTLPVPSFGNATTFTCTLVTDNCTSCNSTSSCQYARVRCVEVNSNTGEIPLNLFKTIDFLPGSAIPTLISSSSSLCDITSEDNIVNIPELAPLGPCCLGGHTNNTIITEYCIQLTDTTQLIEFLSTDVFTTQCTPPTSIELSFFQNVTIPAQIVDFTIVKSADDPSPFLCPDNSSFPDVPPLLCKNFTITVDVTSGCLLSGAILITDVLTNYTDLGGVVTLLSFSDSLTCQLVGDTLSCTSNSLLSNTTVEVHYQICFDSCPFCNATTRQLSIVNTATATYVNVIPVITHSSTLITPLVCPCPTCLCNLTVDGIVIEGVVDTPGATGLSLTEIDNIAPNWYYQGTNCTVSRTNDSTILGVFSYGYWKINTWDCITPAFSLSPLTNCFCDRISTPTNPSLHLRCLLEEDVTVVCCAQPNPPIAGTISGRVEFSTCNSTIIGNFSCPAQAPSTNPILSINVPSIDANILSPKTLKSSLVKQGQQKEILKGDERITITTITCSAAVNRYVVNITFINLTPPIGGNPSNLIIDSVTLNPSPAFGSINFLSVIAPDGGWSGVPSFSPTTPTRVLNPYETSSKLTYTYSYSNLLPPPLLSSVTFTISAHLVDTVTMASSLVEVQTLEAFCSG